MNEPGPPLEYEDGYDCECHDYPDPTPIEELGEEE